MDSSPNVELKAHLKHHNRTHHLSITQAAPCTSKTSLRDNTNLQQQPKTTTNNHPQHAAHRNLPQSIQPPHNPKTKPKTHQPTQTPKQSCTPKNTPQQLQDKNKLSTANIKETSVSNRHGSENTHGTKNPNNTHTITRHMHKLRQTHRPRQRIHQIPLPKLRRNPNQTRRQMPQIRQTIQMPKMRLHRTLRRTNAWAQSS